MLSARLPTFRHVSRTGDKAMALHDPAERLQRGVWTALKGAAAQYGVRRGNAGRHGTALAGGPGYARNRIAARARRSNNPPARCGASDETSGGDRAARNQWCVLS